MASVEVYYPFGRAIPLWEQSHNDGVVPDRWPYGLNKIGQNSHDVHAVEAGPLTFPGTAAALLRRRSRNRGTPSSVALAWEEDLAIRLAIERPQAVKFSGIIWATDRLLRREKSPKDLLLKKFLPEFEGLWALSQPQLDHVEEWLGRKAPPVTFLRFGIDEEFFTPSPYPDRPFVLSVGRDRDRDASTLFEALEEIKRLKPETEIAVQATAARPAPPGVKVLPMMPHTELRDLYRRASVVAVATRPNVHVSGMTVALESMATARPVVISNTPGMVDYVNDQGTGMLVPPGDSGRLATAVLELLDNPHEAAAMGCRGREAVVARHTSTQMARSIMEMVGPYVDSRGIA